MRNEQNANIPLTEISANAPFSIPALPVLPRTLAPGETLELGMEFAPTQARTYTGRLRIGSDQFTLGGTALGAALSYKVTNNGETAKLDPNGSITFRPAQIGKQTNLNISVRNEGTAEATVDTIAIGESRGRFTLLGMPALPLNLPPNSEANFGLSFSPSAEGVATASLVVNASTFSLRGTGLPAAPLPSVSITAPSGPPELLQQIPIGLSLSAPYDIDLIGSLTIAPETVGSSLDPSVQFSTGGRTVAFVVPAGGRNARFTSGLETVRVQTGSVAGTIVLGATLATTARTDVTPAEAPSLRVTLPRTLPRLIHGSVELGQDNSFTLRAAGIAPGRSLARLRCQLIPTGRLKLSSEKLEFDISLLSSSWFRSSQSNEFGGTFGLSVPLRMNLSAADPKSTFKISDVIQAIVMLVEDDMGVSNEVRVSLE